MNCVFYSSRHKKMIGYNICTFYAVDYCSRRAIEKYNKQFKIRLIEYRITHSCSLLKLCEEMLNVLPSEYLVR